MMKFFTCASLLAYASATNASLRGGSVVMSSNAVLSAIPAPFLFMAGSIGEGHDACETETDKVWEDADLNTAMEGLESCDPTVDEEAHTVKFDYPSCDATAAAIAACSSAGGMSYTVDMACSETSGGDWSINYSALPGCAGSSCTMSDFNADAKQMLETYFKEEIEKSDVGGTWSCTATASSSSDPSVEALVSVSAIPAPFLFMAGSIGEGDGTCATEFEEVWKDADLNTAMEGLSSCDPNVDQGSKTVSVDFASCDATAAANTACSAAGGMSYTIDVACSETSGSGRSVDYSKMPSCAGTSCTISDFNTYLKQHVETAIQDKIEKSKIGGTWSCTATASLSSVPSDEALLSVE